MKTDLFSQQLPLDWAIRPVFDAELKEYLLLAYLQRVQARFNEHKLYPHLGELRLHLDELTRLRTRKEELQRELHGPLLGFDPHTGNALYEPPTENAELGVISAVVDMAVPGIQRTIAKGEDLRQELQARMRLEPIGVHPLNLSEGWLLVRDGSDARVYNYSIPLVQGSVSPEPHRSVITRYVTTCTVSLSNTYEHIRAGLLALRRDLPNAATFVLEAPKDIPFLETRIPLARLLIHSMFTSRRIAY